MKIKYTYQKPGPDTIIKYVDENTILYNDEEFLFPEEAGPNSIYDTLLPILEAYRDSNNELFIHVLCRSSSRIGSTPEYITLQEVEDASNDIQDSSTDTE